MQNDTFRRQFAPVVYVPFAQEPTQQAWFFARAPSVYDGLADAVRAEVARLDTGLEVLHFDTLAASVGFGHTQGRDEYTALSRRPRSCSRWHCSAACSQCAKPCA